MTISIEELNKLSYPDNVTAIGLILLEPYKGSKIHHQLKCSKCDNEWIATPISKIQAYKKYLNPGCPKCTYSKRYDGSSEESRHALIEKGFEVLTEGPIRHTTTDKIKVRNTTCGHIFESAAGNLLHRDVQCPICAINTRAELNKERNLLKREKWLESATEWEMYDSKCRILTRQTYNTHKDVINPRNLPTGTAGTKGAYHLDHIVSVRHGFDNKIPCELIADKQNLQMVPWKSNLSNKDKIKFIPRIFSQWFECENIYTFEDMLFKMGFVYDGESPHPFCYMKGDVVVTYCDFARFSEVTTFRKSLCNNIKKYYVAQNKKNYLVFEDEFVGNPNLVQIKIKHLIHDNSKSVRIHARQCVLREIIDPKLKRDFLNKHHIQGNDLNAQLSYGAFYNDNLIAIMTFSCSRNQKIKNEVGVWELVRFATDTTYRIPGIAGKLLSFFKKCNNWTQIYSYADRRWSEGNVYTTLGFSCEAINPPAYWYIENGKRYHRTRYQKQKLTLWDNYDVKKTEFQMTSERGIPRIWDCGTMRYAVYNNEGNVKNEQ